VHIAPQSVDNDFWSSPAVSAPSDRSWPTAAQTKFLFVGRGAREKGLAVLVEAWRASGLRPPAAALVLAGVGSGPRALAGASARDAAGNGVLSLDPLAPVELRNLYAASDVLVLPSIRTATFREPWGLVVNEAMNRGLAVIATDAVGAVAGGLVRAEHNGLVVPAGDSAALAGALRLLAGDARLRTSLGAAGAGDVRAFTHEAWARGFSEALATVGLSRGRW
jgi:glycosyltransferase involved in cell wall biosynthesis